MRKFEMIAFNDVSNIPSTVGLYRPANTFQSSLDPYAYTILAIKKNSLEVPGLIPGPVTLFDNSMCRLCTFLLSYYRWCRGFPCSGNIYK